MSFFAELKRRNVFKVGAAYVVMAWLLAQGVDVFLENFGAPEWVIKTVLLLLVAGFPLALVFAWAFELTPEGIKKEKDVDRSQSITHTTGRKLDRSIIAILIVALGYFVWESQKGPDFASVGGRSAADSPADRAPAESESASIAKSVAVLPFVNMSSDPEQEFFSDGISEEILNALAKVKELKVAGRTSSFAFKGKDQDLRQIGEMLGVEHILEGSVRKSGNTVRITAQLIQVDDGFHLWSDTYDRQLDDIFAIQDEIASAILEQLKAALIDTASTPVVAVSTRTDAEVYDLYLLARQRIYERKRLAIESATKLLDQAISRDPAYAPAYAQRGIAALLLSDRNYGDMSLAEAGAQGKLYLDKALQLEPQLAEAWAGIGLYHANRPTEHRQGIEALEKALAINPNLIDASNWLQVIYSETGESRKALEILNGMVARDPLYPPGFGNVITAYNTFGMQDKSWSLLEKISPFMPNDPQILQARANTWMTLGQASKALPLLERARSEQPSDAVIRNLWSVALLQTAQYDRLLAEDGAPWVKVIALDGLDRPEEAGQLAAERAAEGNVGILIWHFGRTAQHHKLIEFIESRWASLDAFEAEYPDSGSALLTIAHAYSLLDRAAQYEDAMQRVRRAHERAFGQGIQDPGLLTEAARYHAMMGDSEQAIDFLEQADKLGLTLSEPLVDVWPELASLRGEPRFEACQRRIFEHLNAERVALSLEPLSI